MYEELNVEMVITSFEPIRGVNKRSMTVFRGRDTYYWKRHIFNRIKPYDSRETNDKKGKSFDVLIIFDPDLFLEAESEEIKVIFNELIHLDPEKENIFSVEGNPFFAISRGAFKKLKLNLEQDEKLITRLRNNRKTRNIVLNRAFRVLDLSKDRAAVENAVIAHQAAVLINNGVIIEDLGHFFIEGMISIGEETRISSGVVIKGDSKVGKNVHIYPHVYIENSTVGDNCTLFPGCIVRDSILEENVQIGPYTHLRNGALVKKGAQMGNFVEMKKSVLGEGSMSMHLTYIGDADVGKNVNIGAGTITCNYDGVRKNKTIIEEGVFIGSGTELVAPVVVKKNSYVAAGSTITEEVPEESLAVARQKQRNLPGWVTRKKGKKVCKP
jgi:bifunctional UDP-N-acetylglucosamine pyrophosphorylase/glucosamine-1-phosphate N-acetyltransferase